MSPEWIDPEREKEAWQQAEDEAAYKQKLVDEEQEYQRLLAAEGQREEQRIRDNFYAGDVLGFDDGRPGLGVGLDPVDGPFITMPYSWRLALALIPLVIILVASLIVRGCVGEERAQQILHETPPQAAPAARDSAN